MRRVLFIMAAALWGLCLSNSAIATVAEVEGIAIAATIDAESPLDDFRVERRYGSDLRLPQPVRVASVEQSVVSFRSAEGHLRHAATLSHATTPYGCAYRYWALFPTLPRRVADYYVVRLRRLII